MKELTLKEFRTKEAVSLSDDECDALASVVPSITVRPAHGQKNCFDLTPSSTIGAVTLGELNVRIDPKIAIDRVLFLISYALDPRKWMDVGFAFDEQDSLVDAIIPGFVAQIRRAFQRGVLQGYHTVDECINTVRGRIRFADQIRNRFGIFPPIEVRYDEFSEDVIENQLIKAAIRRLRRRRLRSERARSSLFAFDRLLQSVSDVEFPRAPEVQYTRLNEHYRPAIELAKLILNATSFELRYGNVRATSFLVDMNDVFEDFVVVALREALGLGLKQFPQNADGRSLFLDDARRVRLKPDISWWEGDRCVFVGDVKYKKNEKGFKHADLYQLLAYTIATDLPRGLLIYAQGETEPTTHAVSMVGKDLDVLSLDVSGSPDQILCEIRRVAAYVRAHCEPDVASRHVFGS